MGGRKPEEGAVLLERVHHVRVGAVDVARGAGAEVEDEVEAVRVVQPLPRSRPVRRHTARHQMPPLLATHFCNKRCKEWASVASTAPGGGAAYAFLSAFGAGRE